MKDYTFIWVTFSETSPLKLHILTDLQGNIDLVIDFCAVNIPQIKPVRPEATYMIWLDCRAMGLEGEELQRFFVDRAGVGMNEGSSFGPGGEGFMRMNLACQRSVVEKALRQIESAIQELDEKR